MPESRPKRFSAVRSPVRTACAGPSISRDDGGHVRHDRAVLEHRVDADIGVERAEHRSRRGDTADDAGLLEQQLRAAAEIRGDERLRRHVAVADVLGERELDDAVDRVGGQLHCLELRCGARPQHDVAGERVVLDRKVLAEVDAAALGARERALREQPHERRRRVEQPARARRRCGSARRPPRARGAAPASPAAPAPEHAARRNRARARRAPRARRGARRRGTRAASSTRAGSRRARRCTRTRPPRRGRGASCRRRDR